MFLADYTRATADRMLDMRLPPVRDRRPLAVQVYDRLFDALSSLGDTAAPLPTEEELSNQLGVSRTTVRQALALLEEDGVIERGPQRRRHIAGTAPAQLGRIVPLEAMIRSSHPVSVIRVGRIVSPATEWNSRLLGLQRGDDIVTWESEVRAGDEVVASALEFIQSQHEPPPDEGTGTMFARLGAQYQAKAMLGSLRLSPYGAATRSIGSPQGRRLTTVTFTTRAKGKPAYLAKHVVDLDAVPLDFMAGPAAVGAEPEPA